ncbi:metallophosphoesterase family protein [Parasulfitobacter algicola]|uniref:Serine/threonine protein phosphatase n=1 Tax=Parasulfitobacter algicola TaxID=2614809 RepID=A0ABX2IWX4_9RHOB|nr:metallophosphoesterase family protein [Sulfitobacter algicola]NSX54906.1 serine/threonine protein phosphatase [Sulfitobacter algicola]
MNTVGTVLKGLFSNRDKAQKPAPERPVYIIGDVHGRYDLLLQLFETIDEDIARSKIDRLNIVLLGDYIDRGQFSRQVLHLLHKAHLQAPASFICLKGNHEQMLLDFLSDPRPETALWLRYGGEQTLTSFGIPIPDDLYDSDILRDMARALIKALGEDLCIWLHNLPLMWSSGNLTCVHAAADPVVAIADQDEDVLLWGCKTFLSQPRTDAVWIAHGHTIFETAHINQHRIALDTGAYKTGKLSAARIMSDGKVSFFKTAT